MANQQYKVMVSVYDDHGVEVSRGTLEEIAAEYGVYRETVKRWCAGLDIPKGNLRFKYKDIASGYSRPASGDGSLLAAMRKRLQTEMGW